MSKDYHSYVFQDGTFVGNFEAMYQDCEDPWEIDSKHGEQISYDLLASIINYYRRVDKIEKPDVFEIGSGKGYFCNFIAPICNATGLEISPTAAEISRAKFPHIEVITGDIRKKEFTKLQNINKKYDFVIMFKAVIWYVIDAFDDVFDNIQSILKDNGIAIIEVSFYKGDYYGKDVIANKNDFINLLSERFELLRAFDSFVKESGIDFVECSYFILRKS